MENKITKEELEVVIKSAINLATEAKEQVSNADKETVTVSSPGSCTTSTPIKSPHALEQFKLSLVPSLNVKEISSQLNTIKTHSDSIQSMTMFYSSIALMTHVGTHGIVSLPEFKNIDENFNFRHALVPPPGHPDRETCYQHYSCMDKLLANRLNQGIEDKNVISVESKETRSIMDDYYMSVKGFEMSWAIISGLVSRLGINTVECDPNKLVKTLAVKNGGSYKKFCTQAKSIEHALL